MFKKIDIQDFSGNVFSLFKNENALLTAGSMECHNQMTIAWGTLGMLWRKPIAIVYVKPTRYTFDFMNKNDYFTISWFKENNREIMKICGTMSGRDINKDDRCQLTPFDLKFGVTYQQAELVILCRKIYVDDFQMCEMLDERIMEIYPDEKFHRRYIGEIIAIYQQEQ